MSLSHQSQVNSDTFFFLKADNRMSNAVTSPFTVLSAQGTTKLTEEVLTNTSRLTMTNTSNLDKARINLSDQGVSIYAGNSLEDATLNLKYAANFAGNQLLQNTYVGNRLALLMNNNNYDAQMKNQYAVTAEGIYMGSNGIIRMNSNVQVDNNSRLFVKQPASLNQVIHAPTSMTFQNSNGNIGTIQTSLNDFNITSLSNISFIAGQSNPGIFISSTGATYIGNLFCSTAVVTESVTLQNVQASNISCISVVAGSNCSIYGGLGVAGNLSVNGGINMDQGTTLTGPGTITMINSGGFNTGTINGLANIPMAGYQPITITGYNPGNPTPIITLGPYANITTTNAAVASYIGGVGMGVNYNGVFASGGIDITSFKNVYVLDCTSPASALVSLGNPATASILIGSCFFVFGNNAGNVFDFHGCPNGSVYAFLLLTGENNHGAGFVYWNGGTNPATSITWNSFGNGGGSQGPSGGSYTVSQSPIDGNYSRWDYSYSGHAANGYGGVIMFRIV